MPVGAADDGEDGVGQRLHVAETAGAVEAAEHLVERPQRDPAPGAGVVDEDAAAADADIAGLGAEMQPDGAGAGRNEMAFAGREDGGIGEHDVVDDGEVRAIDAEGCGEHLPDLGLDGAAEAGDAGGDAAEGRNACPHLGGDGGQRAGEAFALRGVEDVPGCTGSRAARDLAAFGVGEHPAARGAADIDAELVAARGDALRHEAAGDLAGLVIIVPTTTA